MFGHVPFFAGGFLASPAALLAVDRPSRGRPRTTSISLALSGGVHLLALGAFLLISSRSGVVEPPLIEIRTYIDPYRIPPPTHEPPVIDTGSRPSESDEGSFVAVPKEDPFEDLDRVIRNDVSREATTGKPPVPGSSGEERQPGTGAPPAPAVMRGTLDVYDEPPVPIVQPEPEYPWIAREAGIEGKVVVEAVISAEGTVREVRGVSGNVMLLDAAVKAVWSWRFRPAKWQGQAVAARVSIPFHFTLR